MHDSRDQNSAGRVQKLGESPYGRPSHSRSERGEWHRPDIPRTLRLAEDIVDMRVDLHRTTWRVAIEQTTGEGVVTLTLRVRQRRQPLLTRADIIGRTRNFDNRGISNKADTIE
jgi:hypothetical protein